MVCKFIIQKALDLLIIFSNKGLHQDSERTQSVQTFFKDVFQMHAFTTLCPHYKLDQENCYRFLKDRNKLNSSPAFLDMSLVFVIVRGTVF